MDDDKPKTSDVSVVRLPANDMPSPRLRQALAAVSQMAAAERVGQDKLEIITDLMRGPNGATVEDVVAVTGWPLALVQSALCMLTDIMPGGERIAIDSKKLIFKINDE